MKGQNPASLRTNYCRLFTVIVVAKVINPLKHVGNLCSVLKEQNLRITLEKTCEEANELKAQKKGAKER